MGMFDYLTCELDLPVGQQYLYQTKCIQEWPDLTHYLINQNGRLVTEMGADANFDGDVCFYSNDDNSDWLEYRATFRKGDCVEVSRLNELESQWDKVWPK